jgi:tetratricopeptide (TPR) repeat protein
VEETREAVKKDKKHIDPKRERLFRILLITIPFLFFIVLEAGLRLFGYGVNTDLFQRTEWKGEGYYVINPNVVKRYFNREGFTTYISRDRFLAEKPENGYRIFCLGASTTIGYPYMFNASYPSLLRDRLMTVFPDKKIEVVNLGITAVNSYAIADIARDAVRYDPDLFIVYTGHNEFYGALGVGSTEYVGKSRSFVRLYLFLRNVKIVELVRDALFAFRSMIRSGEIVRPHTLMEEMVGSQAIPFGSSDYTVAKENYRRNLLEIVRIGRKQGVDVLLSTLTMNLRDQPPFVAVSSAKLREEDARAWEQRYEAGMVAQNAGDFKSALSAYQEALGIDSTRADLHYRLAQCYERTENVSRALIHYQAANDLDALRFRATSEFNDVIREVSASGDTPMIDMEAIFREHSPDGIPGSGLFWEHVHPNFDGYFLMGKALLRSMAEHDFIKPNAEWRWYLDRTDEEYIEFAGVTTFDRAVAELRIEILRSNWPFSNSARPPAIAPQNEIEEIAWEYLNNRIGWGSAHDRLAKIFVESKQYAEAEKEMWAIAKTTMYDPYYILLTGDLQVAQRKHRDALRTYAYALRIEESQFTHAKIAILYLELREFAKSIRHFEAALAFDETAGEKFPESQRQRTQILLQQAYAGLQQEIDSL